MSEAIDRRARDEINNLKYELKRIHAQLRANPIFDTTRDSDTVTSTPSSDSSSASETAWKDTIKDKDLTAPPGGESAGDRYIPAATATGAWAGYEDYIAEYNGTDWDMTAPAEGYTVYVDDENKIYVYTGASWVTLDSIIAHLPLAGGQMTGNITMAGTETVDGRDLSVDGTKLDGIESGATADQSNAEIIDAVETIGTAAAVAADGVVFLDDLAGTPTLKYALLSSLTNSILSGLDAYSAGAEVNPDVISQAEAEAGTATTERIWTAERVKQAIAALESGHGSGVVTQHSDVSDAGSGIIISAAERTKLAGIETSATADQTAGEIEAIVNHDNLLGFVAAEHLVTSETFFYGVDVIGWTESQGTSARNYVGGGHYGQTLTPSTQTYNYAWLSIKCPSWRTSTTVTLRLYFGGAGSSYTWTLVQYVSSYQITNSSTAAITTYNISNGGTVSSALTTGTTNTNMKYHEWTITLNGASDNMIGLALSFQSLNAALIVYGIEAIFT